jgi:histone H3/H4
MKASSKASSHNQNAAPTASAAICQQTAYECLHNKMSATELKTKEMWQSIQEELEFLPDNEDYNQAAIPLHLSQKILQEEADFMGFPSYPSTTPDGSNLETSDKSAAAALSKLCELFVLDITNRAAHMRESSETLTKEDVKNVIKTTEIYDLFLDHLNN